MKYTTLVLVSALAWGCPSTEMAAPDSSVAPDAGCQEDTCRTPPEPTCQDNVQRTYRDVGSCVADSCVYFVAMEQMCANGCDGSRCAVGPGADAIAAGRDLSCAVIADGTTRCWGLNTFGRLLLPSTTTESLTPVVLPGLSTATQMALGTGHACARATNGTVSCWGMNNSGQAGHEPSPLDVRPVTLVAGLTDVTAVSAGNSHNCALRADGTVACWGDNSARQLGVDGQLSSHLPVNVPGLSGVTSLVAGEEFNCVLLADRTVSCWGEGDNGRLGDGTAATTNRSTPVAVVGLVDVQSIGSGPLAKHACAILQDRTVWCWGAGESGQIGGAADSATPIAVAGIADATAVVAGESHTCALRMDGTVRCWGNGTDGRLGNGQEASSSTPVVVSGLTEVTALAAGRDFTCALRRDKSIRCWGNAGALGDGAASNRSTPVAVLGIP